MTYEKFLEVILHLQKADLILSKLNEYKVNLNEFVDPYYHIIGTLLEESYGIEGNDWFSWYCYENNFGTKGLEAYDGDDLICFDHESLWKYLEKIKNTTE